MNAAEANHLAEIAATIVTAPTREVGGRTLVDVPPPGLVRSPVDVVRVVDELAAIVLLAETSFDPATRAWAMLDALPDAAATALVALAWVRDAVERGDCGAALRVASALVAGWSSYRPAHGWHSHAGTRLVAIGEWLMSTTDVAHRPVLS